MYRYEKKVTFGRGASIIPFSFGSVITAVLLGFQIALTRAGREEPKAKRAMDEYATLKSDAEFQQWMSENKANEQYFWQQAIVEIDGQEYALADAGFSYEPKQFEVVRRKVEGFTDDLKGLQEVSGSAIGDQGTAQRIEKVPPVGA